MTNSMINKKEHVALIKNDGVEVLPSIQLTYNERVHKLFFKEVKETYIMKYVASKTWGKTVNIKSYYGTKKLGYAGGCGYDKVSACFSDFIINNLLIERLTGSQTREDLHNYITSGAISGLWGLNESSLKEFFENAGFEFSGKWLNKNEYEFTINRLTYC